MSWAINRRLVIGSRGSKLALVQSELVAARLRELGHDVKLVPIARPPISATTLRLYSVNDAMASSSAPFFSCSTNFLSYNPSLIQT